MEISVCSDGQQQYGMKPLITDYTNSLYICAFNTLFSGTGKVFKDETKFRSQHSLRDMLCMLLICHQIWPNKTTLTY